MLGSVIGGFIIILIGIFLFPMVKEQLAIAVNSSNMTGSAETIVGMTTLFFVVAIAITAISMVLLAFRRMGLGTSGRESDESDSGDEDDEDEDEDEEYDEPKPKKSTPLPKSTITEKEINRSEFD